MMSPAIVQAADPSDFDKYESEFKVLDETDVNQESYDEESDKSFEETPSKKSAVIAPVSSSKKDSSSKKNDQSHDKTRDTTQ